MKFTANRAQLIGIPLVLMALGSWLPVAVMAYKGVEWTGPIGRAVSIWYPFPALLAVLVVQGPMLKQPVMEALGLRFTFNRWWLVAWLVPVAVLAIGVVVCAVAGYEPVLTVERLIENKRSMVPPEQLEAFETYLSQNQPPHPLMLVVLGMPAGLTFNLLFALCEEIAFRGYFFREVPGGFWVRSTLLGLLWWIWLAPSVAIGNLYGLPGLQSVMLALPWSIAASWVLVYLRVRSGSVIATALARGTILALAAAASDLTFGAPAWLAPFYGIAGIAGLLAVLVAFWVDDRRRSAGRLMTGTSK